MSEERVHARLTVEEWRLASEQLADALLRQRRQMAAQFRAVAPWSDRTRFLVGTAVLLVGFVIFVISHVPFFYLLFLGLIFALFVNAYRPSVRRRMQQRSVDRSRADAKLLLAPFEPTSEGQAYDYVLDGPALSMAANGQPAIAIDLRPGLRAIVTPQAIVLPRTPKGTVALFPSPSDQERVVLHLRRFGVTILDHRKSSDDAINGAISRREV